MRNSTLGAPARTKKSPSFLNPSYRLTDNSGRPIDTLARKLRHAEALSHLLCGESGEAFRGLSDEIQDNVTWLLNELLCECRQAAIALHAEVKA